jgi:NTP pyrophosphatase (non-canonical NTP hydrolase)
MPAEKQAAPLISGSEHPSRKLMIDDKTLNGIDPGDRGGTVMKKDRDTAAGKTTGMTVRDLQIVVDQWIQTYGVRYFSEMTNLAVLMEEVGELARLMARAYGEQSFKESKPSADLGDEIADVLFVLTCIANQTGVDLENAMRRNLKKKTDRDRDRHRSNPKLKA